MKAAFAQNPRRVAEWFAVRSRVITEQVRIVQQAVFIDVQRGFAVLWGHVAAWRFPLVVGVLPRQHYPDTSQWPVDRTVGAITCNQPGAIQYPGPTSGFSARFKRAGEVK